MPDENGFVADAILGVVERVRAAMVRIEVGWRDADESKTRLGVALVTARRIIVDDVVCECDQPLIQKLKRMHECLKKMKGKAKRLNY